MINRAFVQKIWDCISDVLEEEGFALGGGLAMRAHGIIDRETLDIDAFRHDPILRQPEAFDRAESKLIYKLEAECLLVEKLLHQDFGRKFEITDTSTGHATTVDLGRDRLPSGFVHIQGYGSVVNRNDMAGMKMRALFERHAERDFVDYDAMRRSGIWDGSHLLILLDRTGSITPPEDGKWREPVAEILASAEEDLDDILLEDIGVGDVPSLFERLKRYADEYR